MYENIYEEMVKAGIVEEKEEEIEYETGLPLTCTSQSLDLYPVLVRQ